MTEKRSKTNIKHLAIKHLGAEYDTTWGEEEQNKYAKHGIDILPDYGAKFDFIKIDLFTRNSKEIINGYLYKN